MCGFVVASAACGSVVGWVVWFVLAVREFVEEREVGCREGDVAQMVERSLSMREVLGSIPSFSILNQLL